MRTFSRRLLLLATCPWLVACGSTAAPPANPDDGDPAVESVGWGFFDYTSDFTGGLSNARWGRATGNLWAEVERPPGSGNYAWAELDARVRNAQAARMNGVLVLKAGNGAAFSDPDCFREVAAAPAGIFSNGKALSSCPITPEMEGAWSRWVTELVERYDGDGRNDMPGLMGNVRVDIQVENEASNTQLWDFGETDRALAADRSPTPARVPGPNPDQRKLNGNPANHWRP